MSDEPLTHNEWLTQHHMPTETPKFKLKTNCNFRLSAEAYMGLLQLSVAFTYDNEASNRSITKLLEAIGLNQLTVDTPRTLAFDGVTTTECYEAGCEDAKEKRRPNLELVYGRMPRQFEEAYRRGYLEYKAKQTP